MIRYLVNDSPLDRYYEGKEFETQLKHKKPGDLSPELVEALSIPPLAPPPWLISMQRFGPPPSYPTLRIPGLNAPIPEGWVMLYEINFRLLMYVHLVPSGVSIREVGVSPLLTNIIVRCMVMCLVFYRRTTMPT